MKLTEKKPRGRPANNPKPVLLPIKGIVDKPSKANYAMEWIYDSPIHIKNIFNMIHACNKRALHFVFLPDQIVLICKDHHEKLIIDIDIIPGNMISYYCQKRIVIAVLPDQIKTLCNIIKKSFGFIKFYIKKDRVDSEMKISLEEYSYTSSDKLPVPISRLKIPRDILEFRENVYDVDFKLESNHFKKRLTTYKKNGAEKCNIIYEKDALTKITFSYETSEFVHLVSTKYRNNAKIALVERQVSKTKTIGFGSDEEKSDPDEMSMDNGMEVDDPNFGSKSETTAHIMSIDDKINRVLAVAQNENKIKCVYGLDYVTNIFKTVIAKEFYFSLSNENNICLTFCLDPIDPSRIKKYKYKNPVNKKYNSIVVKIYMVRNL